jgi:FMN-binding protein
VERGDRLSLLGGVARIEGSAQAPSRRGLGVTRALGLWALLAASPCMAAVTMTQPEALAEAFPGARIERRAIALSEAQARAVETRARARLSSRLVTAYLARRDGALVGTAFFDVRTVRTMPAVFMIVVAPDSTVARIDVLAFHEPPDYRPLPRWLALATRHRLGESLWPGRDLPHLSGATLSARAVTEATRTALALFEVVVAPALAGARRAEGP